MNIQMTQIRKPFLVSLTLAGISLFGTMTNALGVPLDVKPGLWEMTVRTRGGGQLPVPKEALSQMSPEQRAAIIAKLEAGAGQPNTMVYNSCVTQEDAANVMKGVNDLLSDETSELKCEGKISKQTSKAVTGTRQCTESGVQETDHFTFQLSDNQHVKGEIDRKIKGGPKTMSLKHSFTGKWISASCGSAK
jgi:hypothetical protein